MACTPSCWLVGNKLDNPPLSKIFIKLTFQGQYYYGLSYSFSLEFFLLYIVNKQGHKEHKIDMLFTDTFDIPIWIYNCFFCRNNIYFIFTLLLSIFVTLFIC